MEPRRRSCTCSFGALRVHRDVVASKLDHWSQRAPTTAQQLRRLLAIAHGDTDSHSCDEVHALMSSVGGGLHLWSSPADSAGATSGSYSSTASGVSSTTTATDRAPPYSPSNVPTLPLPQQTRRDTSILPLPDAHQDPATASYRATGHPPGPSDWRTSRGSLSSSSTATTATTATSTPISSLDDPPDSPPGGRNPATTTTTRMVAQDPRTAAPGSFPSLPPIVPLGAGPGFAPPLLMMSRTGVGGGGGAGPRPPAAAPRSPACLGSSQFAPRLSIGFEIADPPKHPAWQR